MYWCTHNGPVSSSGARVELSTGLCRVLAATAVIDLVIAMLFMLDPELGTAPWPTPIAPTLVRFIGAILLGNAAGAVMVAKHGTWEGARALFTVALVYGIAALVAVTAQLAIVGGPSSLWIYVVVVAIFVVPIAGITSTYERRSARDRPSR
jgi:hypothetical protein